MSGAPGTSRRTVAFDVFEADFPARELRKRGVRLKLQDQPFQVLAALLEKPGEVVTREELQERIWGQDTYVDFDKSLSAAVNKVRQALDDSRTRPRFIETIPKVGYRFIFPIDSQQGYSAPEAAPVPSAGTLPRWAPWAGAGLAAAAALFLWLGRDPGAAPMPELRAVPLTTLEGSEDCPTFSPDGTQVAFAWAEHEGDNLAVFLKSLGSEEVRPVTDHEGAASCPSWSPDGGSIAYLLRGDDGCELRLISPLGGASRTVTGLTCPIHETRLAWSADSRFILYSDRPQVAEPWALFAVDLETRQTQRLTRPPIGIHGDDAPSLQLEGNRLAFIRRFSTYNASEIRTLELGREMTPIRESSAVTIERPRSVRSVSSVVWSRGGGGLLFLDSGVLWRAPASGGEATRLLALGGRLEAAVLSRDGRRVALARYSPDTDIWRLNVSSGEASPLLTSTQVDWFHSISPDGARIAWTSWRSGYSEIWVCDADGSNPLQLTFLETQSGGPMWSPDGRRLVFDTRVNGDGDIYVIDASGGVPHPLVHGPDDDLQPTWSSDDLVYFTSERGGEGAIWSIDVDGREIQRVSDARGFLPKVSPDGRFLYFHGDFNTDERDRVYRRRLADGKEEVLLENVVDIAPTAERIYFSSRETGGIHRLDLGSGQVELLFQPDRLALNIAVSPDEQTILFTQSEPRQSDLLLIEGFR